MQQDSDDLGEWSEVGGGMLSTEGQCGCAGTLG